MRRLLPGEALFFRLARRPALSGRIVVGADGRVRLADGTSFAAADTDIAGLVARLESRYGEAGVTRDGPRGYRLANGSVLRLADGATASTVLALFGGGDSLLVIRADDRPVRLSPGERLRNGDAVFADFAAPSIVTVVGAVQRPSAFPSGSLGETIARAGGLRRSARPDAISIRRDGENIGRLRLPEDADFPLLSGDLVTVPLREPIERATIAGMVGKPGFVELDADPTLAEAIADAGGLRPSAAPLTIRVRSIVRPEHGRRDFPAARLSDPAVAGFALHPGDVIEVGSAAPPRPR